MQELKDRGFVQQKHSSGDCPLCKKGNWVLSGKTHLDHEFLFSLEIIDSFVIFRLDLKDSEGWFFERTNREKETEYKTEITESFFIFLDLVLKTIKIADFGSYPTQHGYNFIPFPEQFIATDEEEYYL